MPQHWGLGFCFFVCLLVWFFVCLFVLTEDVQQFCGFDNGHPEEQEIIGDAE